MSSGGFDWQSYWNGNPTAVREQQQQKNVQGFTADEYGKLDQAEQTLQAMPEGTGPGMIAPDEKRGKLNAIRAMKLKIITPGIAKGRLAKIQDQFGITQPGVVGNVPTHAPMTLSAPQTAPLQGESLGLPTGAIAEGNGAVSAPSPDAIQVPAEPTSNVGPLPAPQQQLPGKPAEQVQLKPYGMNELLAGTGTMPNPYSLMVKQLTDAGIPLDQAQKAVRVKAGIEAAPKMFNVHPNAEVITGSLNGQPFQYQYDKWALQAYDMDGNPIGSHQLQGFVPSVKGALKETYVPDKNSSTGFAKVAYDTSSGHEHSRQLGVLPPRGFIPTASVSVDQFGNRIVTERTPEVPGVGNTPPLQPRGAPTAPAPQQAAPAPVQNQPAPVPVATQGPPNAAPPMRTRLPNPSLTRPLGPQQAPAPQTHAPTPSGNGQKPPMDANGHILMYPGGNQQLIQFANQLIDGANVKDIPDKARGNAQTLATAAGWGGQGMMGPKDKLQLREAESIIQQLAASPALAVLDNPISRAKITEVLKDPAKRGMIGSQWQQHLAATLSPQEQEFVTLFNQAVGRISGLSSLVRPGSKTTEQTIHRLMMELPLTETTTDSNHAKNKLGQLQNEIDIARDKGQFLENAPPIGGPSGGGTQHQVDDIVTLKNGQRVKITSINGDGTFHYDPVK